MAQLIFWFGLKDLVWLVIVVSIIVLVYVGWLWFDSYTEVKGAPRQDMHLCPKHGFISASSLIRFSEKMDIGTGRYDKDGVEITERKEVVYCPLCFHENMQKAEGVGR